MNKKWIPLALVLLLGLALFFVKRWQQKEPKAKTTTTTTTTTTDRNDPASTVNRDRGFDRRIAYLEYSNHAKCRMGCRKISVAEVEEIMKNGQINYNKSDVKNARCPRYAIEGTTSDDQKVRIVFAQCNEKTIVVTVIDLERDWSCSCPGDDDKYENKR